MENQVFEGAVADIRDTGDELFATGKDVSSCRNVVFVGIQEMVHREANCLVLGWFGLD